jgi:alkanesulfonate monooxygenase SsuD/methylene tetrahydromethanopterin reductase-like flavin-dependent oxidoreductase (luciferase family)
MTAAGSLARRAMYNDNRLKLGLFPPNATSSLTLAPERWAASWADNVALAQMADDAGLDFLLPIARWKGSGASSDRKTFETLTWAAALLASTKRITIFATVHAPLVNPVAAAKALVTADHVGGGRVGLNIVVGWRGDEFKMFGVQQHTPKQRYPYAQEWIDVMKRIWSSEAKFDYDGEFLKLEGVEGHPKLVDGSFPLLINAGRSAEGRQYAIRNCDAFFTATGQMTFDEVAVQVRDFQAEARAQGRDLDVFSDGIVVCRATQREAEEYFHYAILEKADWDLIGGRIAHRSGGVANVAEAERIRLVKSNIGRDFVGSPDEIARQFAEMSRAGVRGLALNMVNLLDELPFFRDEVLLRLERLGLRTAVATAYR